MAAIVPALIEMWLKSARGGRGGGGGYGGGGAPKPPKPAKDSMYYLNLEALKDGIKEDSGGGMTSYNKILGGLMDVNLSDAYNAGYGGKEPK